MKAVNRTKSGPGRVPPNRKAGICRRRAGTGPGSIGEFDAAMRAYLNREGPRPTRHVDPKAGAA